MPLFETCGQPGPVGSNLSPSPEWILSHAVTTVNLRSSTFNSRTSGLVPCATSTSIESAADFLHFKEKLERGSGMRTWAEIRTSDGTQVSISQLHLPVYSCPSSLPCSSSEVSVPRHHHPLAEYTRPDADPLQIEAGCRLTRTNHVSSRRTCDDRHSSYDFSRASNTAR